MNIAERKRKLEKPGQTLYQRAARKYNTTHQYVWSIAAGRRKAIRGKAKAIKEWMESELEKKEV